MINYILIKNKYQIGIFQAPIHSAVFSQSPEKVRALIENPKNRADVNTQIQNSGQGPIHLAAEQGLDDVLDVLLSDEALVPNVDARDSYGGQTPLYLAAKNKKEECVRLLLEKGADLNIRCGKDNFTVRQVSGVDPANLCFSLFYDFCS
jgi:ankyrin repeat protein